MDYLVETIRAQGALGATLWGLAFVLWLGGVIWLLRREHRSWQARGKGGSALGLRFASLPILVITVLVVVLPVRSISGMEALFYFYVALFTLGPLCWFGLHALLGMAGRPRLSVKESSEIAGVGLLLAVSPFLVATALQGPIFYAVHLSGSSMSAVWPQRALAHEVDPMRRFALGDAGELRVQTLRAPSGLRLEKVEAHLDRWTDIGRKAHPYLCRDGESLHLAWPVGSPPPPLQLYWRDAQGATGRSLFAVEEAGIDGAALEPFEIAWRDDGFDLPVPLARMRVWPAWYIHADGPDFQALNPLQPHETHEQDCVMTGYRRVAHASEGPVRAVLILALPSPPIEPWQQAFVRADNASSVNPR